jgi:hypothetical protein
MIPLYDGDRLIGRETDQDMALRVVVEGRDAASNTAHTVMTHEVISCFEGQPVEEAS